jgi:hypothetical protein
MTRKRSLFRAAAFTGVAAFLFSFAHAGAAAAQTTTPHAYSCIAYGAVGDHEGECTIPVPAGKRFVIESATVGGPLPATQYMRVQIFTKVHGLTIGHFVPAGYQNPNVNWLWWSGALPGKVVAEGPNVRLWFYRGSGTSNSPWLMLAVSGYLEDI